ncbi:hypothetical protein K2173_006638 [Erythroxylum novogranatense]|uniref:non-specific serine/threonine protein kinase n=1 Tax=Erythroxylum novogranatense TaxID=1862640 RepID=A0AAV8T5H5_9ROSI|nr:hypothetical protein K2173_006638 [Erythroxylum novogranatense]
MFAYKLSTFFVIALGCFRLHRFAESRLVQEEVDALEDIVKTMGSTYWKFNTDSCKVEAVGVTPVTAGAENHIECRCNNGNISDCHVVTIKLKSYSLPGVLPPQLVKLPYLQEIDLAYNYLNGTIPREWALLRLTSISVLVNRLSGEIPKELGNISTLTYLCLEANQFSGVVPHELGKLINLQTLMLSSNQLTGNLPSSFQGFVNLTDLRINDNNFNGSIPNFLMNLKNLSRLEMHASGLEGPIPSNISLLNNLLQLRLSDIKGPSQPFPDVSSMTGLIRLVLRNCNITGEIPAVVWTMQNMEMLDVSFNKLVGKIPTTITAERLRFLFLLGNSLEGDVPSSVLREGTSVDLSYNNFTFQGPAQPACRENMNMNLNLFRSSSGLNSSQRILPCTGTFSCPLYSNCLLVNSGGNDITIKENSTNFLYFGDGGVEGGAAKYYINGNNYWGLSSSGDFMDDFDFQNTRYIVSLQSSNIPIMYSTARITPISLTYFHYCLENGTYTVHIHFAELQFTDDKTYSSLGRRKFDIYIQERLLLENFDIENQIGGVQKPLIKSIPNVNVTNNMLEIRFYYAGKGTTRIPRRSVYGPIVSAISVVSDVKSCSVERKKETVRIIAGVLGAACLIFLMLGILWWKGYLPQKCASRKNTDLPNGTFSLEQIRGATNDFDSANKIGEGGFGPVYKGLLTDGTVIAVKQLSSSSRQGNREFLNEIGMISCLQHPNLVQLHGFCVEGDQLMLVYEYLENNSLARALFGNGGNCLKLDWPTRHKICTGIARGLAFLHEESRLKIVHRDIKATNVLLDKDLNPKISDFGLARLHEDGKSHISTRIAGTIGYMAPEYALWGYLSYKADVYSFGVLALEIVSGKNNNNYMPSNHCVCLLDWACYMQQNGKLIDLLDETLQLEFNEEEADQMLKIALMCTNASSTLRPTMSEVVSMLEGRMAIPDTIPESSSYTEDLRFKAIRDLRQHERSQVSSGTTGHTFCLSSTSTHEFCGTSPES